MATIYVLQGSCGEYSDRTDWIVRAYLDKAKADADSAKAFDEGCAYERAPLDEDLKYSFTDEEKNEEMRIRQECLTVDPAAQFDYTGTTYWVVECELSESK